jgi:type VI secretion system protein ImpH
MAGEDRAQAHSLMDWSARSEDDLRRASMFALVRLAEATESHKPRIGTARRPELSIVDLAQEPNMGFADSTLKKVEYHHKRPQLRGYWLGLTGPMGPLPTHMTEFAAFERRYSKKRPFGDWLDMIAGRMLQLFYRAWADSQPAAHADRPDEDRFRDWLASLSGAMEGAKANSNFFAGARVHYSALFAGSRSAVAIEDALSHLLMQPVKIEEYMPKWRSLDEEDQSRLGKTYCRLGDDAMLGRRVFSASDAFRVIVRAENYRDYLSLMPGGDRFAVAAEAIEAFKPTHLEWSLWVEVEEDESPPARLDGRNRLGWYSWMKPKVEKADTKKKRRKQVPVGPVRADAHLTKSSMLRRT